MTTDTSSQESALPSTDDVREALALVSSRDKLLALYDVKALPILRGIDSSINIQTQKQRIDLYKSQLERTRQLYLATSNIRPTYLIQHIKTQFVEYKEYQQSIKLDTRSHVDVHIEERLWQQLHIVDEIITELVQNMPVHHPVGWKISSKSRNYLNLPTVGKLRYEEPMADQKSINSYVLGHFGVMSYTMDSGVYIGHALGYLFMCYYFSHLSITYGVSALPKDLVEGYDYKSLKTPYLVRLLQTLDGESKKRIYQLAIICAKLSCYATEKRIEKLLIAEVNDFSKKEQKNNINRWLEEGVMPLPNFSDED